MQVRVLFFGMLKEVMGRSSEVLTMRESATLDEVLRHYEEQVPKLKALTASIAMAVNQEYASRDAALVHGDEIALLPPVSGGSEGIANGPSPAANTNRFVRIVREPINTSDVLRQIKQAEDGATVVFEGVVRNNSRGRRTLYLDYEAYEEMALKQLRELAGTALSQFGVREVAILHRLGRLEIGETSVLIVVASAHRAAGYEASRWLIDTLKRTVPIWKKEYFEDGAIWADGEPFPAELPGTKGSHSERPASK